MGLTQGGASLCGNLCVLVPVCQQLIGRIEQLVSQKSTHYYMKAISCIKVFREQSVKVSTIKHISTLCVCVCVCGGGGGGWVGGGGGVWVFFSM